MEYLFLKEQKWEAFTFILFELPLLSCVRCAMYVTPCSVQKKILAVDASLTAIWVHVPSSSFSTFIFRIDSCDMCFCMSWRVIFFLFTFVFSFASSLFVWLLYGFVNETLKMWLNLLLFDSFNRCVYLKWMTYNCRRRTEKKKINNGIELLTRPIVTNNSLRDVTHLIW